MAESTPGPGPEGQAAPLNPQARTDINSALKNAGVQGLDYKAKQDLNSALTNASAENLKGSLPPRAENPSGRHTSSVFHDKARDWIADQKIGGLMDPSLGEKPTNDADVIGGLAINGLDNDPRMETIRQELSANFNDQAKQIFKQRFPEDAEAYDRQAQIYENPNEDPVVQEIEEQIKRAANNDADVNKTRADYVNTWNNTYRRFSQEAWINFARLYPDKAAAYKDKFAPLQQITGGLALPSEFPPSPTPTQTPEAFPAPTATPADISQIRSTPMPDGLPQPPVSEQPKQVDISSLMSADNVKADDFFGLDQAQLYNNVRRLVVHRDASIREKAQKMLDLIEMGKEAYQKNNPDADTISFS